MTIQNHRQTVEALSADLYAAAKLVLLTEDGDLADRLQRAYGEMAIHAAPLAAQLPGSLGDRVLGLHRTFTGGVEGSHEAEGEAVRTTVASMPRDDQVHAAVHLADLADDLAFEIRATHATLDPTD